MASTYGPQNSADSSNAGGNTGTWTDFGWMPSTAAATPNTVYADGSYYDPNSQTYYSASGIPQNLTQVNSDGTKSILAPGAVTSPGATAVGPDGSTLFSSGSGGNDLFQSMIPVLTAALGMGGLAFAGAGAAGGLGSAEAGGDAMGGYAGGATGVESGYGASDALTQALTSGYTQGTGLANSAGMTQVAGGSGSIFDGTSLGASSLGDVGAPDLAASGGLVAPGGSGSALTAAQTAGVTGSAYDPTMSGLAGNNNLPAITAANSGVSGAASGAGGLNGLLQQMGMSPQMAGILAGNGGAGVLGTGAALAGAAGSSGGSGANSGLINQLMGYLNGNNYTNQLSSAAQQAMAASDPFSQQRPFYQNQLQSMYTDPNYFTNNAVLAGSNANVMNDTQRSLASQGYNMSPNVAFNVATRLQQNDMPYIQQLMSTTAQAAGANIQPYSAGSTALTGLTNAANANSANNNLNGQNLTNTAANDLSSLASLLGTSNSSSTTPTSSMSTTSGNSPTGASNTLSGLFSTGGGTGNGYNAYANPATQQQTQQTGLG